MASLKQLDMPELKIEMDVAEEPKTLSTTGDECSGIPYNWTVNYDNKPWHLSATIIKSEPASPTNCGQYIKAEPADHCVTSDNFHPFQSLDKREKKGDTHCEESSYDDSCSLLVHSWSAVNSRSSEPDIWNSSSNTNLESHTESVRTNISTNIIQTYAIAANIGNLIKTENISNDDVIKTEAVTANVSSDVIKTEPQATITSSDVIRTDTVTANTSSNVIKREPVTDISVTVQTCDSVRSDSVSCRETDADRPAGDQQKQEPVWSMTEESPDQPSAVHSTVQPMSDSTSGSLLSVNTSHVHQHCYNTPALFNSAELPVTSVHEETQHALLPESFTSDSAQKDEEKNIRRHVCDVCSKDFTRAWNLKAHKLIHTGQKSFLCDVCDKAFTMAGQLKTHKLIHTGQKSFVCDVCNKAFTEAGNLRRHKLIHSEQKSFVCDVCNKAFTEAGHLRRHKLIHSEQKPFVCDVCKKAFTLAGDLKRHKLIHTGEKSYVCDVCSKAFKRAGDLKTHKLIHSGQKSYVCDVCNKAFTHACSLKTHKLIHSGLKPFMCDVCNKAFAHASTFKRHKLIHSGQGPVACDL